MTGQESIKSVPSAALWLGGLGALPFVALAAAPVFTTDTLAHQAGVALAAYGAVILSFLGGIQWGLNVASDKTPRNLTGALGLSIVPSLVAWAALLLPGPINLLVLAATFVAVLLIDLRAVSAGQAPAWYPKLRVPLTTVVVAALLAGALS